MLKSMILNSHFTSFVNFEELQREINLLSAAFFCEDKNENKHCFWHSKWGFDISNNLDNQLVSDEIFRNMEEYDQDEIDNYEDNISTSATTAETIEQLDEVFILGKI